MNTALIGGVTGIGAGGILLFLAHIAPRFGAGSFVRDTDEWRLFGRSVTRREAHLAGMCFHLMLSFLVGALYAVGVDQGVISGYAPLPLFIYALLLSLVFGGVIMPLEGHGLFGMKEDSWFMIDLVITNIVWVFLFGISMGLWLPL